MHRPDGARPEDDGGRRPEADNGYDYNSFPVFNANNAVRRFLSRNSDPTNRSKTPSTRILAPDLLRGLLMIIMALDHMSVAFQTWNHGTGKQSEADGAVIVEWNFTTAYVVRSLTHLCGSGFTFLLGMGVVFLGRSRAKLGWTTMRLVRYFALRMVVLTVVTSIFGMVMTVGQIWLLNAVLFALAVDYFLAGMLWLAVSRTEPMLANAVDKLIKSRKKQGLLVSSDESEDSDEDMEQRPLLPNRVEKDVRGEMLSWHLHNALLLALSLVTIWWNIWLSPNGGHCAVEHSPATTTTTTTMVPKNTFLRIWFWVVQDNPRIMSGFPPLAWISFSILGILYGRIIASRTWTATSAAVLHGAATVLFFIMFVATRVLRFGNLSENCLATHDQQQHPHRNPYLASPASFFYIIKYPPDVAFWALTMAGNMLLLAVLGAIPVHYAKRLTLLLDFGTTALFFYIVHMLLIFATAATLLPFFGHDTGVRNPMDPEKPSRGIDNLAAYFGIWATLLLVLWPVCRWYSRFKSTKGVDSLWRFF